MGQGAQDFTPGGSESSLPDGARVATGGRIRALPRVPTGAAALSPVGCTVVASASFEDDLVSLIEREDPDVIIVDMAAPGRDTLESLAYVQSRLPRPIVMFAQHDDHETIRLEFLVVPDAYRDVETNAYSHVYLPAVLWAEKEGVFTNTERRVSLIRNVIAPLRAPC